jgi:hypothetical protein
LLNEAITTRQVSTREFSVSTMQYEIQDFHHFVISQSCKDS